CSSDLSPRIVPAPPNAGALFFELFLLTNWVKSLYSKNKQALVFCEGSHGYASRQEKRTDFADGLPFFQHQGISRNDHSRHFRSQRHLIRQLIRPHRFEGGSSLCDHGPGSGGLPQLPSPDRRGAGLAPGKVEAGSDGPCEGRGGQPGGGDGLLSRVEVVVAGAEGNHSAQTG